LSSNILGEDGPDLRNAWFEINIRNGDLTEFLDHVRLAKAGGLHRSIDDQVPTARVIARVMRYSLIEASISSTTQNAPSELIEALVVHKLWTVDRAVASARQMADHERHSLALARIAKYAIAPDPLYADAINAVRLIPSSTSKRTAAYDLLSLAPDHFADQINSLIADERFDPSDLGIRWRRPILHRLFAQQFRMSSARIDEAVQIGPADDEILAIPTIELLKRAGNGLADF
jgi:hypothetical protein